MKASLLATASLFIVACGAAPNGGEPVVASMGSPRFAEGGEKGNGADTVSEVERSAWFTGGMRYVSTCVLIGPGFGVPDEFIMDAIRQAENAWNDYLADKKIPIQLGVLNTWDPRCNFGAPELVYYFGLVVDHHLEVVKAHRNSVAFAHRTWFDAATGRSQGFIWIAPQGAFGTDTSARPFPDWSLKYNLAGILMHELGHVYGVDHVPGTIMDGKITEYLKLPDAERKARLSGIDSYRDLYTCIECPVSRQGFLGLSEKQDPSNTGDGYRQNFETLLGHQPVGPVLARVEGSWAGEIKLLIQDFAGEYEFPIQLARTGGLASDGETQGIFRVAQAEPDGSVSVKAMTHGSRAIYGSLTTRSGQILPLTIEINMSTQVGLPSGDVIFDGIVIKMFINNVPRILFFSALH